MPLIPSFQQIRLSGQYVTQSGLRLQVGSDVTLMVRDSGNFTNIQLLSGTSGTLAQQIANAAAGGVLNINGQSGVITLNGAGTVSVTNVGTTFTFSGAHTDAIALSGKFFSYSGYVESTFVKNVNATGYVTGIPTGSDFYYVSHPFTFARIPQIQLTLDAGIQNIGYFYAVSGKTTSGFYTTFSDIVLETGLSLQVFASI